MPTIRTLRRMATFAVVAALLVLVLAACGGGSAAGVTPPPGAAASIDAHSGQFSPGNVEVPAGQSFQLFFRNLDGEPHNIAILAADGVGDPVFRGDVINDAATTYSVPALPPGTYAFHCDVHPNMTGTIVAKG